MVRTEVRVALVRVNNTMMGQDHELGIGIQSSEFQDGNLLAKG